MWSVIVFLQRNVAVLALGVLLFLGAQHIEILNDATTGCAGLNHIIDITALGCGQWVGEFANVVLLCRSTVRARSENNFDRSLGTAFTSMADRNI